MSYTAAWYSDVTAPGMWGGIREELVPRMTNHLGKNLSYTFKKKKKEYIESGSLRTSQTECLLLVSPSIS